MKVNVNRLSVRHIPATAIANSRLRLPNRVIRRRSNSDKLSHEPSVAACLRTTFIGDYSLSQITSTHRTAPVIPDLAIILRPFRLSRQLSLLRPRLRRLIMTSASITPPSGKKYTQPTGLFINNEFVKAKSGKVFEAINPATSKSVCEVQEAGDEDVDIAIAAARAAFNGAWGELTPTERGKCLIKFAELIEEDAEMLAAVESMNGGKVSILD